MVVLGCMLDCDLRWMMRFSFLSRLPARADTGNVRSKGRIAAKSREIHQPEITTNIIAMKGKRPKLSAL
jgi:hypothetical protein